MPTNCVVAGVVQCNGQPLPNVTVKVRLLDNNRNVTNFNSTITTDANGHWVATFDVGLDIFELSLAAIEITCPDGRVVRKRARIRPTRTGALRQTLTQMFFNISTTLIGKILSLPVITPILSTDFVFLVANGGLTNCCRRVVTPPTTGTINGGSADEARRQAEEAARRAREERERAEEERRRAELERMRAEEERRRAEEARRQAEEERRRAEEAARRAEEAARRAEEAARRRAARPRKRTRMCFDFSGRSTGNGRAGITVSGISVVTDVNPGESAEVIFRRLANMLKARGFTIKGPKRVPGTDEVLLYVISDAAGEDPRGGGIGTVDVSGLGRISAFKQKYVPRNVAQVAAGAQGKISNGKKVTADLVEVSTIDTDTEERSVHRFKVNKRSPDKLVESMLDELENISVSIQEDEDGDKVLTILNEPEAEFPVEAIAIEGVQSTYVLIDNAPPIIDVDEEEK